MRKCQETRITNITLLTTVMWLAALAGLPCGFKSDSPLRGSRSCDGHHVMIDYPHCVVLL